MLPDPKLYHQPSDAELWLTRDCTRQLLRVTNLKKRQKSGDLFRFKNAVNPRALAVTDTPPAGARGSVYYGTIHDLQMKHGYQQRRVNTKDSVGLLHFRYRSATSFSRRKTLNYYNLTSSTGDSARKKMIMIEVWQKALDEAFSVPLNRSSMQQLSLLPHWAALASALTRRWASSPHQPPPALQPLLHSAQSAASRVSVLLVAEARSGSSLVGKLGFDARDDFLYSYEPCRLAVGKRTKIGGTYFGAACARWAALVLQCKLGLEDFTRLHADYNAVHTKSAALAALSAQHEPHGTQYGSTNVPWGKSSLYLSWLRTCWGSHRAAKVVRIRDPAALVQLALTKPPIRIVHLTRDPVAVILSRQSIGIFNGSSGRNYFNPLGGPKGVVGAVCRAVVAMQNVKTLPSTVLHQYSYEAVLREPLAFLRNLYAWLGFSERIPTSVRHMIGQCRLGNKTTMQQQTAASVGAALQLSRPPTAKERARSKFILCEGSSSPLRNAAVQLNEEQHRLMALVCKPKADRPPTLITRAADDGAAAWAPHGGSIRPPSAWASSCEIVMIAAMQRTGSSEFQAQLVRHLGLHSLNEFFSRKLTGVLNDVLGVDALPRRWTYPLASLTKARAAACRVLGPPHCTVVFKLFNFHLKRRKSIELLLQDRRVCTVVLERDKSHRQCSLKSATSTGDWHIHPDRAWTRASSHCNATTTTTPLPAKDNSDAEWYAFLRGTLSRHKRHYANLSFKQVTQQLDTAVKLVEDLLRGV